MPSSNGCAARIRDRIVGLLFSLVACSEPAKTTIEDPGPLPASVATWSRKGFDFPSATHDKAALAPQAPVDPAARSELIAVTPKRAPLGTALDGGTAIGTKTIKPGPLVGPPDPTTSTETVRAPLVTVGKPMIQPPMASPALERMARAQLYWNLVQRCRDKDGKILPADAIQLRFTIDAEGYIVASSILAISADPRFTEAAHCMRRELSTATFRSPSSTRGQPSAVNATVPSVD